MKSKTDEQLLLEYGRTGNRAAFEQLVDRRYADAYRVALHVLRDPERAEECAQEAMARLMVASKRYRSQGSFKGYLYRIVVNIVRNRETAKRRREHHENVARRERVTWQDDPAYADLESEAVAERVHELPSELRIPIVLHYYEGMTHAEVARVLNLREGTASSRLRRGLEELGARLSRAGYGALTPLALEVPLKALQRVAVAAPAPPSFEHLESSAQVIERAWRYTLWVKQGAVAALLVVVCIVGSRALHDPDDRPLAVSERNATTRVSERSASDEGAASDDASNSVESRVGSGDDSGASGGPSSGAPSSTPETTSPQESGRWIEVRVVEADSAAPVAGASLKLERLLRTLAVDFTSAESDAEGVARLGPCPAGKFRLEVHADGYAPLAVSDIVVTDTGAEVRAELLRGAALAGQVTDPAGIPLEHVAIGIYLGPPSSGLIQPIEWIETECSTRSAVALGYESEESGPEKSEPLGGKNARVTLTDGQGRFRLEGLSPGERPVVVVHVDYANASQSVSLVDGEETQLDIQLERGGELFGFACRSDGTAATGATMIVTGLGTGGSRDAIVDGAGRYRIGGLASDVYSILFFDDQENEGEEDDEADDDSPLRVRTVQVNAPNRVRYDVGPAPAGVTVTGQVRRADLPAEDLRVTLRSVGADTSSTLHEDTDPQGRFAFEAVAPGSYRLEVRDWGTVSIAWQREFTLRPGAGEVHHDIDLSAASIAGRVTGRPAGSLASLAIVIATRINTEHSTVTVADPDGRFELPSIAPGTYRLRALQAGVLAHGSTTVTVAEGAVVREVEVPLPVGRPLTVRVIDSADKPVAGAHVVVTPHGVPPLLEGANLTAYRADTSGSLQLPEVADEACDIYVCAAGHPIGVQRGFVPGSDVDRSVTLRLTPNATLTLRVLDASQRPLPGVAATLRDGEGRPILTYAHDVQGIPNPVTDGQGQIFVDRLPVGSVSVEVRDSDGRSAKESRELVAGANALNVVIE